MCLFSQLLDLYCLHQTKILSSLLFRYNLDQIAYSETTSSLLYGRDSRMVLCYYS